MKWSDPAGLRIWRSVDGRVEGYTDDALAGIAAEGFTGVWVFGLLRELMDSRVFPELNRPGAAERRGALQALIERAARHGLGVYLYFNDPVGVAVDDPFWSAHPHLKGVEKWGKYALCTSTPEVQAFFRDAVASALNPLRNLGGVILITACEDLTHCWSKSAVRKGAPPPTCPRCRVREPADLILELLRAWAEVRAAHPTPFRILAWNWEWAYYYPDPQAEILGRLPAGVELLLGFEMGGEKEWQGRTIPIGEYALSYAGPGRQFVLARETARAAGIPVHAKIEINNTHELCTVPNLPVLATLHARLAAMSAHEVSGFLGCWSMGSRRTLNTAAVRLFQSDPARFADETVFLDALAREYFGLADTAGILRAWRGFSCAFEHYPFAVRLLYHGPHNDAPARRLSLRFEGRPPGRSWCADEPGDDFALLFRGASTLTPPEGGTTNGSVSGQAPFVVPASAGLPAPGVEGVPFTLDEVIDGFTRIRDGWAAALSAYEAELGGPVTSDPEQARHRVEELSVARMLSVQFASIVNVFRFYREQRRVLRERGLVPPSDLPRDPALLALLREELANAARALPLVDADPRLGYHQDVGGYKYSGPLIRTKLVAMEAELHATRTDP